MCVSDEYDVIIVTVAKWYRVQYFALSDIRWNCFYGQLKRFPESYVDYYFLYLSKSPLFGGFSKESSPDVQYLFFLLPIKKFTNKGKI